ncbi:hypothetical protein [Sodalis sp. dw_96]|uniref:hypothetical protein n=1 Tax=Sodalis sp. dw_96 TaxID=2719794 RepID=UPI001BD36187|nr:hypothetical protein [Sodalis sp. dw_96]
MKIRTILIMAAIFFSTLCHAAWYTKVDDDIFSGKKNAMLFGDLNSASSLLVFDCSPDNLSISYLEKTTAAEIPPAPIDMLVKVDSADVVKFDAIMGRRNDTYMSISAADKDLILTLLSQIKSARNKILLGLQNTSVGMKLSLSTDAQGSSKAVADFVTACGITLK